ncbi:MAG: oligosaccharide flippase family protein [Verrucomicrobia bacterium]|nr:oligosaccharide flippase family protein [Verrucomicrobiota bacterium]
MWLLTINVCWLVSGFLVGRFLPVKTYGEFQFFCAVLMTLGIFTLPGGKTAVVQSVARGYDGSLVEYVRVRIRHSLAGSGVLLAMTGWYFVRGGHEYAFCFALLAVAFPFYFSFNSFGYYLIGKQRFSQLSISQNLLTFSLAIVQVVVAMTWPHFGAMMAALMVVGVGGNYLFYRRARREIAADGPRDPHMMAYAKQMTLTVVVGMVAGQIDRLALFWLLGQEPVAAYAIAVMIPEQLASLSDTFSSVALPFFSRQADRAMLGKLQRRLVWPAALGVVAVGVGIALMPWVLHLLFAGKYDHAAGLAQLALVGVATLVPQKMFQTYLESQRAVSALRRLQVVTSAIKVGALLVLVPWLGLWGAVASLLCMRVVALGYAWWLARRH